ncbi:MAG TPA: hypothetical protein VM143_17970 [Acidimicrobiales bacterium]|nr:hypothetical protein [Acidimicrobiales bacterium]
MRRLLVLAGIVLVMVGAPGCSSRAREPVVRLDGSPRFPTDEGVATALDRNGITLDGKRTYRVSDQLRSFSTYTRELEPMITRRGQYVQVGVVDDEMVWMSGVARIIEVDDQPAVFYTGRFRETERGRFVFADGTTFAVGKGVDPPTTASMVTVRLDPRVHRIVEITE